MLLVPVYLLSMRLPLPQFSGSPRHPTHIAEVIETSTTEFLSQCLSTEELKLAAMPDFGSFVKARDEETGNQILAVVYSATTAPIDSVHRARALGLSIEELREEQPQIFAMLKTEFKSIVVGYADPLGRYLQYLPPRPPQIHQSVYECPSQEVVAFSEQLDFLRPLLEVAGAPSDALTAATMRNVYAMRQFDREWLVAAGRNLSLILREDYDRLRHILSQCRVSSY
jgi:HAS barrel domain